MIPQRVRLRGFLCYKEEQTVEFDGNATLWMLSGLNGSGKSAVFDAVTYALFGYHRGGAQHAHELINKESEGLSVEFDFLLDGVPYRAKRTLKRDAKGGARGTQQMFRFEPGHNGKGAWVAIEGTGQKREFDAWVAENIGLDYDTFTSSVLLLQGKSEKLLDSKPEGRREVLASIVDLERYERLHRLADDQRKAQEGSLKALAGRLEHLPAVTPIEFEEAKQRILSAEEERTRARDEVERLRQVEFHAKEWAGLQDRLGQARQRWQRARNLLADAPAIEQAVGRLRELREVLPRLGEVAKLRAEMHQAGENAEELTRQRQKLDEQLRQREHALKQARDKKNTLQKLIAQDEGKHRSVAERLRKSEGRLRMVQECEQHESELARLRDELHALPADAAELVERAREEFASLEALSRTVPLLARFQAKRDELRKAIGREQSAQQALKEVEARGKECASEVERLRPLVEEAAGASRQAAEQSAEARALLQQARDTLREITELQGAKVCRHCGQALTEGHLKEEKRRRDRLVREAGERALAADGQLQSARRHEERLREQLAGAEKAHQEAREEYRECAAHLRQARQDAERLCGECAQGYADLPEAVRARINPTARADWAATTYPSAADLDSLKAQIRGLDSARQALKKAEQLRQKWDKLKTHESLAQEHLNRLLRELPDREGIRAEHSRLELEEKALYRGLDDNRRMVKEVDSELERVGREREEVQQGLAALQGKLKEQEVVRHTAQRGIAATLKQLPPAWHDVAETVGLRELHVLKKEQEELERQGTDERGFELQQARVNLDVLAGEVKRLEGEQEGYPPEARQDPAALKKALEEARAAEKSCDDRLAEAKKEMVLLENTRTQREKLREEYLATEKELASTRLLAELLGRDRLQLYLVRQAERQVVEYANAVLDRLSGGQLYLRLVGEANGEGASAKALELEAYNRSTGEKPINVAFLSGSQKFRVAVSLALGIGQYASRQHRPIESVIIDEGFGCLDSQGRQVMIQELQNLRSQMRCILLVSHQEDFADAFSDGYHFQLEGGATRVRRFQK